MPDEIFGKVAAAIQAGNADALTSYLQSPVEITVPGAGSSYSAQKAKFVLQDFFVRYPPIRFSLAHEGTTGATHYATGSYVSGGGTFDTNIFLKKVNDVYKVTELRFESA